MSQYKKNWIVYALGTFDPYSGQSLSTTLGTNSWYEEIAAIMKMAVCELKEKACETDQQ